MKTLTMLKDLQSAFESQGTWAVLDERHYACKTKLEECIGSWDNTDDNYPANLSETVTVPVGNSISIINVCGEIVRAGGLNEEVCDELDICDIDNIMAQLQEAEEDDNIQFVLMNFDTPGGLPVKELAQKISDLAEKKMVVGYVPEGGYCLSAGYWLGSQCSMLFCADTAKLGHVGVIVERTDITKQLDSEGIKVNVLTDGKYKSHGHPATVMGAEEKAMITERLATIGKWFRDAIQSNRTVNPDNLQGQIFLGEKAADPEVNLADGNFNSIEDLLSIFLLLNYL